MRERVLAEAARRAGRIDPRTRRPARPRRRGRARRRRGARVARRRARDAVASARPRRSPADHQMDQIPSDQRVHDRRRRLRPTPAGRPCTCGIPASLDALAGSQAVMRAAGPPAAIRLNGAELRRGRRRRGAGPSQSRAATWRIDGGSVHALVPLTVTPDRAPDVRITAPAKDLRVPSTAVTIPIAARSDRRSRRCDRSSCATRSCRAPASSSRSPKGRCRRRWRAARTGVADRGDAVAGEAEARAG